ncbi:hypothetical protein RHGRI_035927 [Rhododendron griersonianum]|uniref:Transposase n=1 Tax=Rhododendron griersonianum TaxID=479676 RepID=A0AAV6HPJ5_9ERIC|nr:hypothetical protein RHGRI_035927 [Rhododendron griersonianum]
MWRVKQKGLFIRDHVHISRTAIKLALAKNSQRVGNALYRLPGNPLFAAVLADWNFSSPL